MTELLIKQSKDSLKVIPIQVLFVLSFFSLATYLSTGFSIETQSMLFLTITFTMCGTWYLYISSQRQVLINKSTGVIQIAELSFWGTKKNKSYALSDFGAVQSYITHGKGSRNIVELVTKDANRGLVLSSYLPCGGKRFWSLEVETENQNAINLAIKVSEFTQVNNLGFIGHKFATNQIGIENDTTFISNMF